MFVLTTSLKAQLANGFDVVCVFVNDNVSAPVIDALAEGGVKLIALRCAGFNNVDLNRAEEKSIEVGGKCIYWPFDDMEIF